jgi:ribonucleoside-diphosphate reductase alpha chain
MINQSLLQEEALIRDIAREARHPQFNWGSVIQPESVSSARTTMRVRVGEHEREFNIGEIALTIGNSLSTLMAARDKPDDIFTDENKRLVQALSVGVAHELSQNLADGSTTITGADVYRAIQRVLTRNNLHDVARTHVQVSAPKLSKLSQQDLSLIAPILVNAKVIRRDGHVTVWNQQKIENAARRAFHSLEQDSEPAARIAEAVSAKVSDQGLTLISVEALQDMVEEELMAQGHFKVARAYIQYRGLRADLRKQTDDRNQSATDDGQITMIMVRKSSTETYLWDGADLKKRIEFASVGLDLCLTRGEIEAELRRSTHDDITEDTLRTVITLNAKTLMSKDADFAKFAGRILLTYMYEETLGWSIVRDGAETLPAFHRRAFKRHLSRLIELKRLTPDLQKHDLDKLADALDPTADLGFEYLGLQTLFDRYLLVDKSSDQHVRLEVPQTFWMRVAMGIFVKEAREGRADTTEQVIALYRLYKSRRFCSSTPTLFNAGTPKSQLSSCYLYKVEDSIESIMQRGIAENAYLSKWAGGLGGSWTAVRGVGSYIHGTNGESQGVVPFLKLHNDQLLAVNQGGKRRGSGCAYLEIWHNDIEDFLHLRKGTGDERRRTHDLNTANWIPDLFMKRFESRQEWTLFRSNEVPDLHDLYGQAFERRYEEYEALAAQGKIWCKKLPAVELWKEMLKAIFETGHPWITFKDACNVRSPQDHAGVIHSSNLCTEITLNTGEDETAVCNLGSILIENHLDAQGNIDHPKLRETVRIAVRVLDNVIDINFYPTQAAQNANMRHRPIGLGVMGLSYALFQKNLPFGSKEAIDFNDEMMEAIAFYAYEASSDLAAERGQYSSYPGSKWSRGLLPQDTIDLLEAERGEKIEVPRAGWMDWTPVREKIAKQGMRNSNVLAIAPTATISNIMGSSPCIEPLTSNLIVKSNMSGEFPVLNPYLIRDLKARSLWTPEMQGALKYTHGELGSIKTIPDDIKVKYLTAFGVDPLALVEAASRRQKWIDQSQSVNLWFAGTDMRPLSMMYRTAWRKGLKTTYYLRSQGASNIEQSSGPVAAPVAVKAVEAAPQSLGADAMTAEQRVAADKVACSLEAMKNGGVCESCQ